LSRKVSQGELLHLSENGLPLQIAFGGTGSIAVGNKSFIENVKARLGFRAKRREVINGGEGYHLRESSASYKTLFGVENEDIDLQNTYFWAVNVE